jgi:hypothetical protein
MDSYDGKRYIINKKQYSEKEVIKYLKAIGFNDLETIEYLNLLQLDYADKLEKG